MDQDVALGLTCVFTAEVFNKDSVVFRTEPFHNTVLDVGLLSLYNYSISDMALFVNVGTSSIPVKTNQTGLQRWLYSCNTVFNSQQNTYYSSWPVYRGYNRVIQFPIGTVTGVFTEVGVSRLANAEYLNRQLFKNADGDYIAVRVKADEGLRITCDLRLYPQKDTKVYSQVYNLWLGGATAGSIVFKNATAERTLTLAELKAADTAKLSLENLTGISSIANYVISGEDCKILCHPSNSASIALEIKSHTLTGGISSPQLTELQSFIDPRKDVTCPLDPRTTGLVSITPIPSKTCWAVACSGMNKTTMKNSALSGTQFSGWFEIPGTNIMLLAFKNINPVAISGAGAGVLPVPTFTKVLKEPALLDYSFKKKCYYAPAVIGAGTQPVTGITCIYTSYDIPVLFITAFAEALMVVDTEELSIDVSFSWDRYIS